jgi:thiol-disulfide isomerase/thioredoxin
MTARRTLLLSGFGLATAAAVAGWAWQRELRRDADERAAKAAQALALASSGGLWVERFERPGGGELVMDTLRGRPLLVNFWATWCPPCVKEMPEIDRFARAMAPRGQQVVGLAIDSPVPVREFLARTPVGYAIGLAGLTGSELAKRLGNEMGGLPFTALFDRRGALVRRKLGETTEAELLTWVDAV